MKTTLKLLGILLWFVFGLFLFSSKSLADWSVWDTPKVYYDFQGPTSSVNIKDRVGDNNLTLTATAGTPSGIVLAGKTGRAVKFNGSTEYGSAPDSATFSATTSFSVEAWVKFAAISQTDGTIQTVLAKWDETTDIRTFRLSIKTDSTGRAFPQFEVSTDGTAANIKTASGKTQILSNKWYLFTGYYNATNPGNIYIYVNGVREGATTSVGTSISDTAANFYLGTTKTGASTYANFLNGFLDEVRFFTGTRTEGAIAYSMERGKPVTNITFDDGSGFQAMDHSEQSNPAALVNFPTGNSQWIEGVNKTYGLQFDGSTNYVDLGYRQKLQLGGGITISAWINPTDLAADYTLVSQPHTNGYTLKITAAGEMTFGALGATTVTTTGAGITAGTWQYVTISYNGANASFYKNARLISSPALSLWSVADGTVFAGRAGTTPQYFKGKMDELTIYPYNRTAFEVAIDLNQGLAVFGREKSLQPVNAQISCPTGFIPVPGDPLYGTTDFCVMKYEAKCDVNADGIGETASGAYAACNTTYDTWGNALSGCRCETDKSGHIVSSAAGAPLARIAQDDGTVDDSKSYCSSRGWHLITNNEWMTIARNAEKLGSNWCSNNTGQTCGYSPGTNSLTRGHADGTPGFGLQASTLDSQACYGTVTKDVDSTCGAAGTERRIERLSNGEIIWDLAGNVWEWTDNTVMRKDEPECQGAGCVVNWQWSDFAVGSLTSYLLNNGQGASMGYDVIRPSNPAWNANQSVGRIYHYSDASDTNTTLYAFVRGGSWGDSTSDGVFTLSLNKTPDNSSSYYIGFRCAVSP